MLSFTEPQQTSAPLLCRRKLKLILKMTVLIYYAGERVIPLTQNAAQQQLKNCTGLLRLI